LEESVINLKQHTCRYAKSQLKWIHHRFLKKKGMIVHNLHYSILEKWESDVVAPALEITEAFQKGLQLPTNWSVKVENETAEDWKKFVCKDCNGRVLNGRVEWQAHLKSKGHRAAKKKKTKLKSNN